MAEAAQARQRTYAHTRWNFVVIVLDAAFFFGGLAFIDPVAVLPVLVGKLGGSDFTVGTVGTLQRAGWIVPQIIATSYVLHHRRKKKFVMLPVLFSRIPFFGVALAFMLVPPGSSLQALLFLLIGAYALFFFGDGLVGVPWHDIVARTIPPTLRGRFFGSINILGGIFAVGAGDIVRRVLADPSLPFPHNYGRLFVLLCVCMGLSTLFLAFIKEPPGTALEERHSLPRLLRAVPTTLRRHRLLGRLILAENLMGLVGLATLFYAVFGHRRLGLPEWMGGIFIWATTAGTLSASLVWAYLNDRKGPLTVIRGVTVAGLLVPIAALGLPPLARAVGADAHVGYVYCATFLLNGIAMAGGWMGITNYVLEIAPDDIRPLFLGLSATLAAPAVLMPLVGGLLLRLISYESLFVIAAAGGAVAVAYVFTLERPRVAQHAHAGPAPSPSPASRPTLD
jgi:MFS family permease